MNWSGAQAGEGFEYHLLAIGLAIGLLTAALDIDPGETPEGKSRKTKLERRNRNMQILVYN